VVGKMDNERHTEQHIAGGKKSIGKRIKGGAIFAPV